MKRENKNFLFNVAYQLVMYLFPLLTSAYISRTLGVEKLGVYSYVASIVTLASMLCLLGISNYGNREIAKIRDDEIKLSRVFSSIYTLQIVFSAIVIVVYYTLVIVIPSENNLFFLIQGLSLFSAALDNSWVFFGLEKFKITLTRNFVIRCISMILVVAFVKSPEDLWKYAAIMSLSSLISQAFLWYLRSRIIKYTRTPGREVLMHLKPICVLFIPVIAFSVYQVMDKTMLGAIHSTSQLAYYENAERVISIPSVVINALGTVMLPHMAYSIFNNKENYLVTIKNSMHLATEFAAFAAVGLFIISDDLAVLLYGKDFLPSGHIIALLSFNVIAVAWANVIRTQFLIPTNHDLVYVSSTFLGAALNLLFNLIFIKKYGAVGACIGTIIAEFSIAIYQTVFVFKELQIPAYIRDLVKSLAAACFAGIVIASLRLLISQMILRILLQVLIAVGILLITDRKFILTEFLGIKKTA